MRRGRRVVAVDPFDEYSVTGRGKYTNRGPLLEAMSPRELALDPDKLHESGMSLAVVPEQPATRIGAARAFSLLSRLVRHAGDAAVICSEVGLYAEACGEQLKELATTGRHAGLMGIFDAQRPALIPATVRSQCDCLVAFHAFHPADLEVIREVTGDEEFTDAVTRLDVGQCLLWRSNQQNKTRH